MINFKIIKLISEEEPKSFTEIIFEKYRDAVDEWRKWKQVSDTVDCVIKFPDSESIVKFSVYETSLSCRGIMRRNLILTYKPDHVTEYELTIRTQKIVMQCENYKY